MDFAACGYAVDIKDSCEEYAECYKGRQEAYMLEEAVVKGCKLPEKYCPKELADKDGVVTGNEKDRKAEWVGLKKMKCLVDAFGDGKVESAEISVVLSTTGKGRGLSEFRVVRTAARPRCRY